MLTRVSVVAVCHQSYYHIIDYNLVLKDKSQLRRKLNINYIFPLNYNILVLNFLSVITILCL